MVIADEALTIRAKCFRGLADASRLALLLALREGEKPVSTLVDETGLSQSNASRAPELPQGLWSGDLVVSRQEWSNVYYRVSDERVEELLRAANDILSLTAERVSRCVDYCNDNGQEMVRGGN